MDDVTARVTAAVQRGRAGERAATRQELAALWAEVDRGDGDDFHRRVIAHFMADLQDYGVLVRSDLEKVGRALAEGSTEPLPSP